MADVVVGYLHPGVVSHSFHQSTRNLQLWDQTHNNRILAWFAQEQGAGGIANGRNAVVREFLSTEAEWLLFVDADMGFEADALDRLLEEADPKERPILGGLAFAQHIGSHKEAGAKRFLINPTIYTWTGDGVKPIVDYPKDEVVECDATGAAFLLIHREVLETLRDAFQPPYNWFAETLYKGTPIGEDVTFCRRAVAKGYPIHIHTGVRTSHHKQHYVDEEMFDSLIGNTTPTEPQFAIVGTGRSGSGYVAKVLSELGITCGHEEWWNPYGERRPGLMGDSSWLAVPLLGSYEGKVGLQLRDPLKTLSSLMNGEFFGDRTNPYYLYMADHVDMTGDDLWDAATFIAEWIDRAEDHAIMAWRVEDLDGELVAEIAEELAGAVVDPRLAQVACERVSSSYNKHPQGPQYVWKDLPDDEPFKRLRIIAERYGYAS